MSKRKRSDSIESNQATLSQYFPAKKAKLQAEHDDDEDDDEYTELQTPKSKKSPKSPGKKLDIASLSYKGSKTQTAEDDGSDNEAVSKSKPKAKGKASKSKGKGKKGKNKDPEEDDERTESEEETPKKVKKQEKSSNKDHVAKSLNLKERLLNLQRDEKRHKEFVKKLGAVAEWERKAKDEDNDDKTSKDDSAYENTKGSFTPLEKQFIAIRKQYPGVVLFVEHGYRYKLFGKDAATASEVLKIQSYFQKNFLCTAVPVHRFHIHARRLIQAGYKVGVVSQTETAALKAASSSKGKLFGRALTALYTKSTFVGQDIDPLVSEIPDKKTIVAASEAEGEEDKGIVEDFVLEDYSPKFVMGNYLMCISEEIDKAKVKIAVVAVQTSTGHIIYDYFEDGFMRRELETRLSHINPIEILLPETVSDQTEKLIKHFNPSPKKEDLVSLERYNPKDLPFQDALNFITSMFSKKEKPENPKKKNKMDDDDSDNEEDEESDDDLIIEAKEKAMSLVRLWNPLLITCFGILAEYAKRHNLESLFFLDCNYHSFESTRYMKIDGNALKNLEILQSEGTYCGKGTLFWVLNRTCTSMGKRLLLEWIKRPLYNHKDIIDRFTAVDELIQNAKFAPLQPFFTMLSELPDIERGICRIYYKKCSAKEFLTVLLAFRRLAKESPPADCVESSVLKKLFSSLPSVREHVETFLRMIRSDQLDLYEKIQQKQSKLQEEDEKVEFKPSDLLDDSSFPAVASCKQEIADVEQGLEGHLRDIRKILGDSKQKFITKLKDEYVIEVKMQNIGRVPTDWKSLNSTKTVKRYHTPYVITNMAKLNQARELLLLESKKAWDSFLGTFGNKYSEFRKCVAIVGELDCLHSLSLVAQQEGFVKPQIVAPEITTPENSGGDMNIDSNVSNASQIRIKNGRHPVLLSLTSEVVPNSVNFGPKISNAKSSKKPTDDETTANENLEESCKCMLLTGPNMGGKTSYTRMVALICVMAQMGSYVPADSAVITPLDAIFTRMGAHDNMARGESTFLVELMETSRLLALATTRSLVLLDELGRGTSTHDGIAIAYGTLYYLLDKLKPFTLFVTHFPSLRQLGEKFPNRISFHHMGFLPDSKGSSNITFLYKLMDGVEGRSYGLNVAQLANLNSEIVKKAEKFSMLLEKQVMHRQYHHIFKSLITWPDKTKGTETKFPEQEIETLQSFQNTLKFLFKQEVVHKSNL